MILYLSMFLGILFIFLGKLNKAWLKPDFSWKLFFKLNLISFLLTAVAGLILMINQKEVVEVLIKIFPNFPFVAGGLFSAVIGAGGITIFQIIIDVFNPNKKTAIGLNK